MTDASTTTIEPEAAQPPRKHTLLDLINEIQNRVCGLDLMRMGWNEIALDRGNMALSLAIDEIAAKLDRLEKMVEALPQKAKDSMAS